MGAKTCHPVTTLVKDLDAGVYSLKFFSLVKRLTYQTDVELQKTFGTLGKRYYE